MELRHLRYFVAVAEELHFGHAASRLSVSQPSLSQQVQNLERELKVDLFVRTKRRVALTPAGRRFLREARAILAAAENAAGLAREAARAEARRLVIGIAPDTDWISLGRILRHFADEAPLAEVSFQTLTPEDQASALLAGKIDIGFVTLPLEVEGLVTEATGRIELVVALPVDHRLARNGPLGLEELSGEAYMLWPRHLSPGSYDYLLEVFRRAGFGPPIAVEGGIPSTRTVLGMIAAGLTIALVDPVLRQMGSSGVVFRELRDTVAVETGMIYRSGDSSPLLASFLALVRAAARTPPGSQLRVRSRPARGAAPGRRTSARKR